MAGVPSDAMQSLGVSIGRAYAEIPADAEKMALVIKDLSARVLKLERALTSRVFFGGGEVPSVHNPFITVRDLDARVPPV